MTGWVKVLLPVVTFVVGYAGARSLSGEPPPRAGDALPSMDGQGPTALPKRAIGKGVVRDFATYVDRRARAQDALAAGDYEILIGTEWEGSALMSWAKRDPAALWAYLQSDGGWERHIEVRLASPLFKNWFRQDPDAAVAVLWSSPDYQSGVGRWAIFEILFDDDPAVVRAVGERLDEFAHGFRPVPGRPGSRHWRDGLQVVERMRALPESRTKQGLIEVAMGGWAERDWREALAWTETLPEGERLEMQQAMFSTAKTFGFGQEEAELWAVEFLSREENRELRVRQGTAVVGMLAREDPAAAMQWAEENLGRAARAKAIGAVVAQQLRNDTAAGLAMVDDLPPGALRDRVGRNAIRNLRTRDAPLAYERALGELRRGFDIGRQDWGQIGVNLGRRNPEVARQILTDLPEGVSSVFEDTAVSHMGRVDPAGTLEWANALGGDRGEVIARQVFASWENRDPVAARQWRQEHP